MEIERKKRRWIWLSCDKSDKKRVDKTTHSPSPLNDHTARNEITPIGLHIASSHSRQTSSHMSSPAFGLDTLLRFLQQENLFDKVYRLKYMFSSQISWGRGMGWASLNNSIKIFNKANGREKIQNLVLPSEFFGN